jgi:hypothetical protein
MERSSCVSDRGVDKGTIFTGSGVEGKTLVDTGSGVRTLQVVFDATDADSANWTMTFYEEGTEVGGPTTAAVGSYADIRHVGFCRWGANGTIDNFTFTQDAANVAPTINITSPASGEMFAAGDNITIETNASDPDGTVAKVEFYANGVKLGEVTTGPFNFTWNNVPAGNHVLTAVATDNEGLTTQSESTQIGLLDGLLYFDDFSGGATSLGGTSPDTGIGSEAWIASSTVHADGNLTGLQRDGAWLPFAPQAGYVYTLSADVNTTVGQRSSDWIAVGFAGKENITSADEFNTTAVGYGSFLLRQDRGAGKGQIFAGSGVNGAAAVDTGIGVRTLQVVLDASDADPANWTMAFYEQGTKVGGPTTASVGNFADIHHVGFSRWGANGTIDNFTFTQDAANVAPTVSIMSPTSGAMFTAGDDITIETNAADSDGTVAKVEFYADGVKLGEVTTGPFNFTWNNVPAGNHLLAAVATDDEGAQTESAPVAISDGTPVTVYFDDFSGGATSLGGTTPDTGSDTWIASSTVLADGNLTGLKRDGAWLPFEPQAGYVYTLSADVNTIVGQKSTDWIAVGFAGKEDITSEDEFNSTAEGYGNFILRQNRGVGQGTVFTGSGVNGRTFVDTGIGVRTLQVVLDASDPDPANWTMAFYEQGTAISGPTTAAVGSFADIRHVGFNRWGANGTIDNFRLDVAQAFVGVLGLDGPAAVIAGGDVELTADSLGVDSVTFYRDADGDGILNDTVDTLLGTDANPSDGWSWTDTTTAGLSAGTYTYFAQGTVAGTAVNDVATDVSITSTTAILDDGDPGFTTHGSGWQNGSYGVDSAVNDDYQTAYFKSDDNRAIWSFTDLPQGVFDVYATYVSASNHAELVPYGIYTSAPDGQGQLPDGAKADEAWVDQSTSPTADLVDGGTTWEKIGRATVDATGQLSVQLVASSAYGGWVVADAVRVQRIDHVQGVIDDADLHVGPGGAVPKSIDLDGAFGNVDGLEEPIDYSVDFSNPDAIASIQISNGVMTVTPSANVGAAATITVTVTDASLVQAQGVFNVEVIDDLIENGSFEYPVVSGNWDYMPEIPEWERESGPNFEIQNSLFLAAAEGSQYAELDAHPYPGSMTMSQTVDTVIGATYRLTFAFAGRPGTGPGQNHLGVDVLGVDANGNAAAVPKRRIYNAEDHVVTGDLIAPRR